MALSLLCFLLALLFPEDDTTDDPSGSATSWVRDPMNPILRDLIPEENYQVATDSHVFIDENGDLYMLYSGDVNGNAAIKVATGSTWNSWTLEKPLLSEALPSGLDTNKETSFYRSFVNETGQRLHQIYYIGYADEVTYESQIFLAESVDNLLGPYTVYEDPILSTGVLDGRNVPTITSMSVVEHDSLLYMTFMGWNAPPSSVTEIWQFGATSQDQGRSWENIQELDDISILTEGQITKRLDGTFVAVRTANNDEGEGEAIFYATADHPFGPWSEPQLILSQAGPPFEKDEIIAAQITVDPESGDEYLYYTGADQSVGWWIMLATPPPDEESPN